MYMKVVYHEAVAVVPGTSSTIGRRRVLSSAPVVLAVNAAPTSPGSAYGVHSSSWPPCSIHLQLPSSSGALEAELLRELTAVQELHGVVAFRSISTGASRRRSGHAALPQTSGHQRLRRST
jgi:hypothetical protein